MSGVNMPKVALNNGRLIPILGLGTWKSKPGEVTQAVKDAIDCGYRHIDCAFIYGNEPEVGVALREKFADGTVTREDMFITSKLWNTFHSRELVIPAIKKSLENLGLDYLDLYLIHWPMGYQEKGDLFPKDDAGKILYSDIDYLEAWYGMEDCISQGLVKTIGLSNFNSSQIERVFLKAKIKPAVLQEGGALFPTDQNGKVLYSNVDYLETWSQMEECVRLGLTKAIGLSNFNKEQTERILSIASIRPANNQIECHPYLNQKKLIEFCKLKGVTVTAYSPLGSPDRPWAKPEDPLLLEDPKVKEIAERYNKTTAQVLIRYQVQRGVISIPKSVTKSRIESNIQVFDFKLSEEDMKIIDTFDCNGRLCAISWISDHPHYPFHTEF